MSKKNHKNVLLFPAFLVLFTLLTTSILGFSRVKDILFALADNTIVNAQYQDLNTDGTIDNIHWELDENVTACVYEAGDWSVDFGGDMNIVITGISCTGADNFLEIAVNADPNLTGSSSDPVISYANQGNLDDVTLTSGPMTDKLGYSAFDGASPVLISDPSNPQYLDSLSQDGQVDVTYLFFTEVVIYTYDDSDWTATANDLTGYDVIDCLSCIGANPVQLLSIANPGITGVSGGTEPTLAYNFAVNAIYDSIGNYLLNFGPVSVSDDAAPLMVSGDYLDTDFDGTVDTIRTTWSENVTMSGSTVDDWTISPGDINAVFVSAPDDATDGLTLDVLVTADTNETGGVVNPSIIYDNDDANNSIIDSPLAAVTNGLIEAFDQAAPVFVSSVSADANSDGTVDQMTWNFSEPVNIIDGNAGDGFNGVGVSACSIANQNLDSTGVTSKVVLLNGCTAGNTAVTIDPNYVSAGLYDITDGVNEMVNNETVVGTDGAGPIVMTSLSMLDVNTNGFVDRLTFSYSESLANTAAGANGFNVTSAADHGNCTAESADPAVSAALQLSFSCDGASTAVGDLTVAFTANAGVTDAAGNQSPTKNFTSVSTPAIVDAASPVVLSWALDLVGKLMTLNFSESVDVSTLVATGLTVQDDVTATQSFTLTGGTSASPDGAEVVVDLLDADVTDIEATAGLAKTVDNTYLTLLSSVIDDLIGLDVAAIMDASALQAGEVSAPTGGGRSRRTVLAEAAPVKDEETTSVGGAGGMSSAAPDETSVEPVQTTLEVKASQEAAIRHLAEKGVLKGNLSSQTFLRRFDTMKMIASLLALHPDVAKEGDRVYSALERALIKAGILSGSIRPQTFELRANFLTFVLKAKMIDLESLPACEVQIFADVLPEKWYCPVVEYARSEGWIPETSGLFTPSSKVTRGWAAGVLDKAFLQ